MEDKTVVIDDINLVELVEEIMLDYIMGVITVDEFTSDMNMIAAILGITLNQLVQFAIVSVMDNMEGV